jgi:hypothetical protein
VKLLHVGILAVGIVTCVLAWSMIGRTRSLPTALIDDMTFKDLNLKIEDIQFVPDPRSVAGNYRVNYRFTAAGLGRSGHYKYVINWYDQKDLFLGSHTGFFVHHEEPNETINGEVFLRKWVQGDIEFMLYHSPDPMT